MGSGATVGSEADIGVEADVDGSVSSGNEVGDDPADGLSTTPSNSSTPLI